MRVRRSWLIFAGFAAAYLVAFAFMGYEKDGDNIAARPFDGSVHILLYGAISRLGLGGAMKFVYALVFAQILTGHVVRRRWERLLFFASPFVLANATDIFNRFMLCLVCAHLIDWGLRKRRRIVAAAAGFAFASSHPFNAVFLLAAAAPLLGPLTVAAVAGLAQVASLDMLGPLFSDKRALLHAYGPDLRYLSQGTFAIDPSLQAAGFGLVWWLAVLLPGIGTSVPPLLAVGSAGFHALWMTTIVVLTPHRRNLLLVMAPMTVLVALFVGNSAVGYRHLLPVFYAALVIFGRAPGRSLAFGLVSLRLRAPADAAAGSSPQAAGAARSWARTD